MNKYRNILLAGLVIFTTFSCKEDEDLLGFNEASNKITFPDYPGFSATFTTLDMVVLDVEVEGSATSLSVTNDDGDDFGSVSVSGGAGNFTSSLAALGNPSSETLIFGDGETVKRFGLSIVNPADFTSSTSSEVELDSTFSIVFEAETENGSMDSYDLFLKIGSESAWPGTANASDAFTGSTAIDDSVAFTADDATYDIGDSIYYKVEISAGSLLDSITGYLRVVEVALSQSGTITLRTPDYDVGGGETDSLRNAYNFKAFKYMADSVLATDPDSADVMLVDDLGGELDLEAGAGSGTTFVVADETYSFGSSTYESIRDAYDAGIPSSSVTDIESLYSGAVILIELGNIPQSGAPAADNRRYAAIQITGTTKADGGVTSDVTLDYIAPAQPED
ncbi:hypothetical protein AAOE16_05365 [Ekhidna sp. MALMAid0563]|uniref:hypothetical protein n=1 Tax=Ekhidna sp. MALMAid0563 TaxID=3143937 RepID=UPI0032DFC7A8